MAIESTNFFSFLQQTRSPIGLVDQYNLSEIYTSDQNDALRSLLLDPEGLDEIYNLSQGGVIKEDIRLVGGLKSPAVESLGLLRETAPSVSGDLASYVRVGADVGEPGKQSFISPTQSGNLVVFHGGLAARNIEYNYLNIDGESKTTAVSTSRESLFNTQADADGNYTSASFAGSTVRVRRRGHFNELKLNNRLFVKKSTITESPGAIMRIPTYVRTPGTPSPAAVILDAYATKNSPLELPIKVLGGGSFTLGTVTPQNEAYYFGYEIKRKSDGASVATDVYFNDGGAKPASISVSFNLNGTIGNNTECILLIYCSPSIIKSLNLAGLGIKEDLGKDIGLVGFDVLEEINLSSNGLKNIPTWLKVNYKTLRTINLTGNPFYNNGPTAYFDHQNNIGKSGSSSGTPPLRSAVQVLAYSGFQDSANAGSNGTDATGKYSSYDGTLATAIDGAGNEFVDARLDDVNGDTSCVINEENGFRVFDKVESLSLGSSFYLRNADFSKLFPELLNVYIPRTRGGGEIYYGSLPKLNNNLNSAGISFNLSNQYNANGNIRWVGDNPTYENTDTNAQKNQFIGQFKVKSWNTNYCYGVCGGVCTDSGMLGSKIPNTAQDGLNKFSQVTKSGTATAATAWSGWTENMQSLNVYASGVAVNVAEGPSLEWKKLSYLQVGYGRSYGGSMVRYNQTKDGSNPYTAGDLDAYDKLYANKLTSIQAYYSGWYGRLFSIADNAKSLKTLQIGNNDWEGYTDTDGSQYIFPDNFVERGKTNISDQSKVSTLYLYYLHNGSSKELQFRSDEFVDMGNLTYIDMRQCYFWGIFPEFINQTKSTSAINIYLYANRFYDLRNLGANLNSRFRTLWAPNQGISRGGAIIPSFDTGTSSNNTLYDCEFYGSLYPYYPGAWNVAGKRNRKVFSALKGVQGVPTSSTSVDPVSWASIAYERNSVPTTFTSRNRAGTATTSRVLRADTDTNLQNYVRVGDEVYTSASGGAPIGKVCQVRNTPGSYVVITEEKSYSGQALFFQRAGVDAKDYFRNCTNLGYVYLNDCSLVGTVPDFKGNSGRLYRVRLQSNLLTKYRTGTLANITGQAIGRTSRPNLQEFNLSNNPLSLTSIRDIIQDAYDMAVYYGSNMYSVTINLTNTKADIANETLSNYTNDEIFYLGTPGNPGADPPISATPDPLLSKFNQLGSGNIYSRVNIILN